MPNIFDKHLKHEIEFMKERKKPLPNKKRKNKIEQLLFKYKHGNDICEHRKQHNECSLCFVTTFYRIKIFDQSDEINLNWTSIPDHPYEILIVLFSV